MKLFVSTAALALAVAFAAPAFADSAAAPAAMPAMSEKECTDALAKCTGTNEAACRAKLETEGCKAPEAAAK